MKTDHRHQAFSPDVDGLFIGINPVGRMLKICYLSDFRQRSDRKRPGPFKFGWQCAKSESFVGQLLQAAHMLDNQNFFVKQKRVNRPGLSPGVVDIDRIDANELDATGDQIAGRVLGQMGMVLKVLLGSPILVPTAMHKDRASSQLFALKEAGVDGQVLAMGSANDDPLQVSEPLNAYL
jgi:hypothetical protein